MSNKVLLPFALLLSSLSFSLCLPSNTVASSSSPCKSKPIIFNFGDSNSDTGGLSAALGFVFGYPDGRAFFRRPTGRLCDGRLIIDFLSESLNTSYLTPYLESIEPDFANGVNFAIAGSETLPRYVAFSLDVQVLQFRRFYNRSVDLQSMGFKNLVREEDFGKALCMIDIGQNDLSSAFNYLPYARVVEKIPSFIAEIRDAMWGIYQVGVRRFWVHGTGPLGCLPRNLATTRNATRSDFDEHGCLTTLNEGSKAYNAKLQTLVRELRSQMTNSTIVYVDVYSIKYDLVANSTSYGFKNPLTACCGHGGAPYNVDPDINCREKGSTVCDEGERYVSWDGVHYTEAANAIVASKILSTNYSTPPIEFSFFC